MCKYDSTRKSILNLISLPVLSRPFTDRFGTRFTKLMGEMVLISEVGNLSCRQEAEAKPASAGLTLASDDFADDGLSRDSSDKNTLDTAREARRAQYYEQAKLDLSQKHVLNDLLGE